jgi:surface protein
MEMIVAVGIIITLIIIGAIATLTYFFVNVWSNNKSTYTPDPMKINIEITDISNNIFELPLTFTGNESVTVDWGDKSPIETVNTSVSHTYKELGNYTISITGKATQYGKTVSQYNGVNNIKSVSSWGDLGLKSLAGAFRNATTLTSVPNYLPSSVTNLDYMFVNATYFNGDITRWNTENVTSMSTMFADAQFFDQDISNWNTVKVTDMGDMFSGCQFNQDIGKWDTKNVTIMAGMFSNNYVFDQNLNRWNVSKITDASNIFFVCPMLIKYSQYPPFDSNPPGLPVPGTNSYYG